jgi:magnesium chelatase accessory protein
MSSRPLSSHLERRNAPDAAGGVPLMQDAMPPADWPNRSCSRMLNAAGVRWHVQRMGSGPELLLVHGTGASTHSWGGLMPLLARHFDVLAPDLPGHGFSSPLEDRAPTLPNMAGALGGLLQAEQFKPELIVGHSAGAAIALQMALAGGNIPRLVVGLNAALLPYGGWLAPLAQPLARAFTALAPVPKILAARARQPGTVERLIASTGSRLGPSGIEAYRSLLGHYGHVEATLAMMANWDLKPLLNQLSRLETPLCLVVGEDDRTVPPSQAAEVIKRVPRGRVIRLGGLGHLAHEENPRLISEAIDQARTWGLSE